MVLILSTNDCLNSKIQILYTTDIFVHGNSL